MTYEELKEMPKDHIINHTILFRHGLIMWRELYRRQVGEEKYQETLEYIRTGVSK